MQAVLERCIFHARGREPRLIRHSALLQQHLQDALRDALVPGEGKSGHLKFHIVVFWTMTPCNLVGGTFSWLNSCIVFRTEYADRKSFRNVGTHL